MRADESFHDNHGRRVGTLLAIFGLVACGSSSPPATSPATPVLTIAGVVVGAEPSGSRTFAEKVAGPVPEVLKSFMAQTRAEIAAEARGSGR